MDDQPLRMAEELVTHIGSWAEEHELSYEELLYTLGISTRMLGAGYPGPATLLASIHQSAIAHYDFFFGVKPIN